MKRTRWIATAALCAGIAGWMTAGAALAAEAWTSRPTNVRAGPEKGYPLVTRLGPGMPVDVVGCLAGYSWCDVIAYNGSVRGWVSARALQYPWEGRRVPLYSYGASIGLPIITWSLLPYWDNYYRGRPFYRERPRWERYAMPAPAPHIAPPRPHQPEFRPPRPPQPEFRPPRPERPEPPRPQRPPDRPQAFQPHPGGQPLPPPGMQQRPQPSQPPQMGQGGPGQRPQGGPGPGAGSRPQGGDRHPQTGARIERRPPEREPGGN